MYLLDTNICIALMNENRKTVSMFTQKFSQCYLSTIVISELYKGIYCSQQIQKNLDTLARLTELLPTEPFGLDAAREFGLIQAELKQIGRPTGAIDVLIAAVARSRQDIVVTGNVRDFENIPNLHLENWL